MLRHLKTDTFVCYHISSFRCIIFLYSVGLLGSSHIMELDLRGEVLRNESSETTVPQNSSNRIRKLKWHGCINKYIFTPVLQLLTLSGRFRFGFGLGYISNTIEL